MTYRPTIRMDDVYKEHIDRLFRVTSLDRNQLMRAALFTAFKSEEYRNLISNYKTKSSALPTFHADNNGYWLEQTYNGREEREERHADTTRGIRTETTTTGTDEKPRQAKEKEIGKATRGNGEGHRRIQSDERRKGSVPSEQRYEFENEGGIRIIL